MRKLALIAVVGVSTTAAVVVAACGLALATSLPHPKLELVSVRPMLLGKFVRVHVRCPDDPEGVCYLGQVALFDRRHHFLGLSTGRRVRSGESIVRSVPLPAAARHRARANGKLGAIALIVGCGTQCKRTWSFMRGQAYSKRLIVIRAPSAFARPCSSYGGQTLVANSAWRVFVVNPRRAGKVRSCRRPSGPAQFVDYYDDIFRTTGMFVLRRDILAHTLNICDGRYDTAFTCGPQIVTYNLATHRRRVSSQVLGSITDLRLGSRRRWAIIIRSPDNSSFAVFKQDTTGLVRLAQSGDVVPRSLRIIGERIIWRQGDATMEASFR